MKEKEVKKQEITQTSEGKEKPANYKEYDYAHLVLFCGSCKSKYIVDENVKKGSAVQIFLPPTNVHEMRLVCKDCGNEMSLFYIESNKKDEITNKESIKEPVTAGKSIRKEQEGDNNESVSEEGTDQKQPV